MKEKILGLSVICKTGFVNRLRVKDGGEVANSPHCLIGSLMNSFGTFDFFIIR